jgi:iron(III) transport system permease protein
MAGPETGRASARSWGASRRGATSWGARQGRSGRGKTPRVVVGLAVTIALLAGTPIVYLLLRAFEGGPAAFWSHVTNARAAALLGRTLLLGGGVALLSAALALPTAWLVSRTDLPGRRVWAVLLALPLVVPSYVAAYCLVAVLGPRGLMQDALSPLGVERLPDLAYGYSGALVSLALYNFPYVWLLLVAALRGLDPALEESARTLGRGGWRTFWSVTLPQLRPALSGGTLLVVLYALSDFGAVSIAGYPTLTLGIYTAYGALFDRSVAAALALLLVALTLLLLGTDRWLVRGHQAGPATPRRPARLWRLGRWRWPCIVGLSLLSALTLGMPALVLVFWSLRALAVGNPLETAFAAAMSSVAVSLVAALAAIVLALPVGWWRVRSGSPAAHATEMLANAGYALPGLVVALACVVLATRTFPALYQSIVLLTLAYVVRFLPQALAAVRSGFLQVPARLEEAARSLGRSPSSVFRSVTVPLLRPSLLAGAGLVFLTTMKELPATLLLRPTGFETLATRVWSTVSEGVYSAAAVPSLLLLAVTAPVVYLLVIRPVLAEGLR